MKSELNIFRCPRTGAPLACHAEVERDGEILSGYLEAADGVRYPIIDGVATFLDPAGLSSGQRDTLGYYEGASASYDDVANLSFSIQCCDEEATRRTFVDRLQLRPDHRVLELACGTGRDSVNIAGQLGRDGRFYLQDLSRGMLTKCREKLRGAAVPLEFSVGDACRLPFPDRHFDAVFSFGGIGVFGDIAGAFREIVRVVKPGGRVVVGDESLAPWLYETEYGHILLNNNPLFKAVLPLADLPREARDVRVQWVVGGVYYLIDFTVGEGDPPANFDQEIPGVRGGTLRTRYYGKLEGIRPETLALARRAREKSGKSMHAWLDEVIGRAARAETGKSSS